MLMVMDATIEKLEDHNESSGGKDKHEDHSELKFRYGGSSRNIAENICRFEIQAFEGAIV